MTASDAKLAVANGASAIIISNHGARQLDYVPATVGESFVSLSMRVENGFYDHLGDDSAGLCLCLDRSVA